MIIGFILVAIFQRRRRAAQYALVRRRNSDQGGQTIELQTIVKYNLELSLWIWNKVFKMSQRKFWMENLKSAKQNLDVFVGQ